MPDSSSALIGAPHVTMGQYACKGAAQAAGDIAAWLIDSGMGSPNGVIDVLYVVVPCPRARFAQWMAVNPNAHVIGWLFGDNRQGPKRGFFPHGWKPARDLRVVVRFFVVGTENGAYANTVEATVNVPGTAQPAAAAGAAGAGA
ncbi:hypothetical protein TeGR_g10465 [Tetraparma gracilis]|uniref:Uncharacterized protein n=1 Tax=Tetraparma gracilis TaxID=2962635 RepID=A0ABQ6M863_9STRA|nr:hypothetical protein TeGR_g10465 [Tetraparma gracilis]